MKTLLSVVLTAIIALVVGGCGGQKMMEPMASEMSSMEKPMDKTMKEKTMMEDSATDTMNAKKEPMEKSMQ